MTSKHHIKSAEAFTDADVFELHFLMSAPVEQKATIIGAAMFLKSLYFETSLAEVLCMVGDCLKFF
jgi:hypothetical protein